jgi:hypothetical protein
MSLYDKKSIPQLIKIAEKHFNAYIRHRDTMNGIFRCISCGSYRRSDIGVLHAGHFYAAGNYSGLRFNENNVHGQCSACNTHKHGNLLLYRENLIKKISLSAVEELEQIKNRPFKWDRSYLVFIIETYKAKLKQAA